MTTDIKGSKSNTDSIYASAAARQASSQVSNLAAVVLQVPQAPSIKVCGGLSSGSVVPTGSGQCVPMAGERVLPIAGHGVDW